MKRLLLFAASVLLTAVAPSQSFVPTVLTPGRLQAGSGATAQSAQIPVGPLAPASLPLSVFAGAAGAGIGSVSSTGDFYVYAAASGSAVAGAGATSGDWRVDMSSPVAGYVALQLTGVVVATAGTTAQVEIDVGDDGTIEVDALNPYRVVGLQLGPVPMPVRVRVLAVAPPNGSVNVNAAMRVVPPLATQVQRVLVGCQSNFSVATSPANDQLWIGHMPCSAGPCPPRFLVFGFGSQAVLLQAHPLCGLLLPTPDVVLAAPSTATVFYSVPIPASVRPFTIWTQAVALTGPVLTTSDAYMVIGQP